MAEPYRVDVLIAMRHRAACAVLVRAATAAVCAIPVARAEWVLEEVCDDVAATASEPVSDPARYRWSSHRANAPGVGSDLCTPRDIDRAPGQDGERLTACRAPFVVPVDEEPIADLREAKRRGHALGHERFIQEMGFGRARG